MLLGGIHIIWPTTLKITLTYSLGPVKFMALLFLKVVNKKAQWKTTNLFFSLSIVSLRNKYNALVILTFYRPICLAGCISNSSTSTKIASSYAYEETISQPFLCPDPL